MSSITFQNPDTGETELIHELNKTINEIGKFIMQKYNYSRPPIFSTIYKENPMDEIYLEEDDVLSKIYEKKLDESTPIWWRSSEISGKLIYKLRTDRISRAGYNIEKIQEKSVFIAGVGLLGSEIALDCAVLGIKKLHVLDYGMVDWFNIYRQSLYGRDDVFQAKVDMAKKRLESMGDVSVTPLNLTIPSFVTLTGENEQIEKNIKILENEIKKCDIIITSLDTYSARMIIQTIALANDKLLINTAAGMIGGIIQIVGKDDPCLACGSFFERKQDTGACTLASFGTQKIISGFTMEIITDFIQNKKFEFNYLKYNPFKKEVETSLFEKGKDCVFCNEVDGIIKNYKSNKRDNLINWLLNIA